MALAKQIDALWSGLNNPINGKSFSGAIVGTFAAGTSTPKAVWEDANKTLPTAAGQSQFTLDSNGQAKVYGDGSYQINVYAPEDTGLTSPVFTIDSVQYVSLAAFFGDEVRLSSFGGSLNEAILSIGTETDTHLVVDVTPNPLTADTTIGPNIVLDWQKGNVLQRNSDYFLTICPSSLLAGRYQIFENTGSGILTTFSDDTGGGTPIYPEWWGAKGDDSTDCFVAINAAVDSLRITGGIVSFGAGFYRISGPIQVSWHSITLQGSGNSNTDGTRIVSTVTDQTVIQLGYNILAPIYGSQIRNLRIDRTVVPEVGGLGVYMFGTVGALIEDVNTYNCTTGYQLVASTNCTMSRLFVNAPANDITFYGLRLENNATIDSVVTPTRNVSLKAYTFVVFGGQHLGTAKTYGFYSEYELNSTSMSDVWLVDFSTLDVNIGTFMRGPEQIEGAVSAFADAGGGFVTVNSVGHGMKVGGSETSSVTITGTTNYDGVYTINSSSTTVDTFVIRATWVATETGYFENMIGRANVNITFRNPVLDACTEVGMYFENVQGEAGVSIEGGWLHAAPSIETTLIRMEKCENIVISGGTEFWQSRNLPNLYTGVFLVDSSNITVSEGLFQTCKRGVRMSDDTGPGANPDVTAYNKIIGCTFTNLPDDPDNAEIAILLGDVADRCILANNIINGYWTQGIKISTGATNTSAYGNIIDPKWIVQAFADTGTGTVTNGDNIFT